MILNKDKLTLKTEEILKRRKARQPELGGIISLTVGPTGSGKTSQLLFDAKYILKNNPNELVFFRDSTETSAQFNRIGNNYNIFVSDKCTIRFRDLINGGNIDMPVTFFSSYNDIINQDTGKGLAEKGKLNVIYFQNDYEWIDFLKHLRNTIGWQSVFIEEIEDIIPLNPSKEEGESKNFKLIKNGEFSNNAKHFRRGLINMYCNTQNISEIDWRFMGKVNMVVYLRGSRVSKHSRIRQGAVNNLQMGVCWIDWEYRLYGRTSFTAFPPKDRIFEVIIE